MKAIFNIVKNIRNSHSIGLIVIALLMGSLHVWGATYFEDTFSDVGNSDNQSITSRSGWGSFTKCYSQGNSGLRVGSGNAVGAVTKTAMTNIDGTKNIKVTIYVSQYNTQAATLTISATNGTISAISGVGSLSNGQITITPSGNAGATSTTATATWTNDYKTEFTITGASSSTTITFSTTRRLVLGPVKVEDAASTYTVTIAKNEDSWGTVSANSVASVASGTSISAAGNVLTIGEETITATEAAKDANYSYAFDSWTIPGDVTTVTADITVTANFTRSPRALTNYRTSCCTSYVITLSGGGTVEGGTFSAGSARACVDGEVTLTADLCGYSAGTWTVTKTGDPSTVVTVTNNKFTMPAYGVTVSLTTSQNTDHFIDRMHRSSGYTGNGASRSGCDYTVPNILNKTPDDGCWGEHYKFVGWAAESDVNLSDGTLIGSPTILMGNSHNNATGTTYYAIWAAEVTE